ncbi:uncharacterized protein LOC133329991 [Musca vetustissima]|uniref:uncharacterized protein LOC133329991 n=1 Tax=Musca vetustissima TaxID=27455 RepID=UPI002AB695E7|nr:uncharacterized protein LOC133329991 [Musca vetustissima]
MKSCICLLLITLSLLTVCEARGGRRGGSMGGMFGSWRKYKKPSSSSSVSSRRIVSSSPVHTPITKALNEKKATGGDKFIKNGKTYGSAKYNTPPLPPGGSYYQNTAAMPANAVYIAQAPPRGADFGDFLTGYLTGRLLTMGLSPYPYHHHVTHVYHDNPNQAAANNGNNDGKVIIINNGQDVAAASAPATTTSSSTSSNSPDSTTEIPTSSSPYALAYTSSTENIAAAISTTPPPNGIICVPIKMKEKNSNGDLIEVDRIVCYPAPPPPAQIQNEMKSKPVEIAGDIVDH